MHRQRLKLTTFKAGSHAEPRQVIIRKFYTKMGDEKQKCRYGRQSPDKAHRAHEVKYLCYLNSTNFMGFIWALSSVTTFLVFICHLRFEILYIELHMRFLAYIGTYLNLMTDKIAKMMTTN